MDSKEEEIFSKVVPIVVVGSFVKLLSKDNKEIRDCKIINKRSIKTNYDCALDTKQLMKSHRITNVLVQVLFPKLECGQIYLNFVKFYDRQTDNPINDPALFS